MTTRTLALLALPALFACSDPVIDDARDALGPEEPGVPEGPLHRPGQPCVLCHDEGGPGDLVMVFGGTFYKYKDNTDDPLPGVFIDFIDSTGATYTAATNCAGNFYVQPTDFNPTFPVWIEVRYGEAPEDYLPKMSSPIFREGSCAACHGPSAGPASAGPVYFSPIAPLPFPEDGCP